MKNKDIVGEQEDNTKRKMHAKLLLSALCGNVFDLRYSLKCHKITEFTTTLGYFHDMKLLVIAENENEAVRTLNLFHDNGTPEAVKVINLGKCVKWPNNSN